MKSKFYCITIAIVITSTVFSHHESNRAPEIFCQGVHTCLSSTTWRSTCSVDGYFESKEEARSYLSEESCCEESLIDSYSIGFNLTGCGTGAP